MKATLVIGTLAAACLLTGCGKPAGDSTTGTAFLIDAVASGHKAARGIQMSSPRERIAS